MRCSRNHFLTVLNNFIQISHVSLHALLNDSGCGSGLTWSHILSFANRTATSSTDSRSLIIHIFHSLPPSRCKQPLLYPLYIYTCTYISFPTAKTHSHYLRPDKQGKTDRLSFHAAFKTYSLNSNHSLNAKLKVRGSSRWCAVILLLAVKVWRSFLSQNF